MTGNQLVSRQATNGITPHHPAQAAAMTLSEVERVCNMISTAGDLVPTAYRSKPGAVLLAKLWGDANGVDLFTALQNISPIEGRPYVSAEMRVALGVKKGFEFRTPVSTREECTVEVWRGGECIGSVTARIDDQPRKLKTAKGFPTPWATHPDDMLFAEACRKADRRHVRTAAALLDAGQDYADEQDTLLVLASQAPDMGEPAPAPAVDDQAPAETRSEVVDVDEAPPMAAAPRRQAKAEASAPAEGAITEADLKAWCKSIGLSQGDAIRAVREQLGHAHESLADVAADPHAVAGLKDWAAQP